MTHLKSLSASAALLLCLTGAAQADVTSAEVWANWKAAAESTGQTLTPGSESQDGGTLTIRDLSVTAAAPEMTMTGSIAMIEFREQPGGTVAVTMSPSYDMVMSIAPETGEKIDLTLSISQPDISLVASGGDGAIGYDISGPEVSVSVSSLTVEGAPIDATIDIVVNDVTGRYDVTPGEMTEVASTLNAASVALNADVKEPGGPGTFTLNAMFADLATSSTGTLMMLASMEDFPAMLKAGYATSGNITHGASNYAIDFQDDSESFAMSGSAATGQIAVSFDADAISYKVGNTGVDFTMSGSEIPLPEIAGGFAEIGFSFLMPLAVSEEPRDFGMNLTFDGISVSDMIWGMADPTGTLSHDPATLIVDVSGKANWLIDIMNPDAAEAMEDQMPGQIHALDLNDLRVAIAGAVLTGMGSFTFDNSDWMTFDGIPAPTGSIDLTLVGANALLDKLVAMGLLPEDQAMGARMMMGLFARPGDGEDTLVSKIEVTGDGAISANGQRLQ